MPLVTARDLGQPPGICADCWSGQHHHKYDDTHANYYCAHHRTWAMPKVDYTGWIVLTGVTQDEFVLKLNRAARMFEEHCIQTGPKH